MVSTGDNGLDQVIAGLRLGDNVVWQVESIEDYNHFVQSFVKKAKEDKRRLVYIRFASHKPLLKEGKDVVIYKLDALVGFESFSTELHRIISKEGDGVFYVFDCLSDLLSAWSNDLMIGNFFKITCPYLFELNTIAYFALLRNSHSFKTVARIRDITQLLIDVYYYEKNYYVHPIKVWNRYSSTMFLPHVRKGDQYVPIASSVETAKVFSSIFKKGVKLAQRNLDYWDKLFIKADNLESQKNASSRDKKGMIDRLCRMIISRDEKIMALAKKTLKLRDFLDIRSRMIGTGFVGGKTVGMLLARNILLNKRLFGAEGFLEPHDSFYIGSDVFYTYMVENDCWSSLMEQRTAEGYFEVARTLHGKLLLGDFPETIKEQFRQMLEYFGQSPIIVRSSSLLEDGYGNAFAGKYESIFLSNQGTPEERYTKFIHAVRRIYSSTMNEEALAYRLNRGLDQKDEQMALLVQRVSGAYKKDYFFPDVAGVGISYNTFVWKDHIDPKAGMLRLVLGLGTRAVNRVDGDYPRIVALDDPLLKAHGAIKDAQRFSQHDIDVLNIKENAAQIVSVRDLVKQKIDLKLELLGVRDDDATEKLRARGIDEDCWIITFDKMLSGTKFPQTMQKILQLLEATYDYPVDIEFTVNFIKDDEFRINLLQCRPVQTKGVGRNIVMPKKVAKERLIFQSHGNFLGGNISQKISRIIYVDPEAYNELASQPEKYDIARIVGVLNRQIENKEKMPVMLLGPGRWGTSTPSLGVPVSFSDINNISVLGEIAFSGSNAMPEPSFGTHFFQDLVETGIFYLALFPDAPDGCMNQAFFDRKSSSLAALLPEYAKYKHVVKVFDIPGSGAKVFADIISQKVISYL
jgi:hypothetical protein